MNKTNIEWCDFTWNPITGCRRGCDFCYARRIHERFNKTPFSAIVFHKDRLTQPYRVKKPSRIFVGSMSDIEYWKEEDTRKIITVCADNQQHTFLFLTKNPDVYFRYVFPPEINITNSILGLTITGLEREETLITNDDLMGNFERHFYSIEPLLNKINLNYFYGSNPEFVAVGAMTGINPVIPKPEWIESVKNCFPADKIIWKNNIKKYL